MAATKTKQETTTSKPTASKTTKTTKKATAKASKSSATKSKKTSVAKPSKTATVAKSTKKKASKSNTVKAKPAKPAKTVKAKTAKAKTKSVKSTVKKTATKRKSTKVKTGKNTVATFLAGIVKQATKVQKQAQTETKAWIKSLNTQDKQLSQLTKKANKATPKGKSSIEKKINKLQSEMSVTRTGLLNAENATDKVATLIEWVSQLNAKPAVTAFLRPSTSKPSLVKNSAATNSKKGSPAPTPYEEEDYLEENDQEMNFMFGEDDDEEASR